MMYPEPKSTYKVLVQTNTYNQVKYIQDTLNGVAKQDTTFPFVNVVIDDCSTDGGQDVIQSWLNENCEMSGAEYIDIPTSHVVIVKHKTNINCTFAVYYLKRNLWKDQEEKSLHTLPWEKSSEYIALCEGDDYWTDPYKLQNQIDYLETHPEYSMCFHSAWNQYGQSPQLTDLFSNVEDRDYSSSDILSNWIIPTASVVFRKEIIESSFYRDKVLPMNFMFGDTPLFLTCARLGKVRGFSDTMSVYRRHDGGISRGFSVESYNQLADYSMKLGEVFEMEEIGRTMSCRALFDGFCFSLKKRRFQCSLLYRAFRLSPSDVYSFIVERVSNAFNK